MRGRIIHAIQHCRSYDSHVHNHHVLTILQFLICPPTARLLQSVSDATYVPEALSQPDTEDGVQVSSRCLLLLPRTSALCLLFLRQLLDIDVPNGSHLLLRQRCLPTQIVFVAKLISQLYELYKIASNVVA